MTIRLRHAEWILPGRAKPEKKKSQSQMRNPRWGSFNNPTMALLASGLAAGLCPICCTEPQLAGSPAASMYQYGAGAGIRCDTSVLVPAVTLLVGEAPARREKKTLGGAAGVPRPVPKAACLYPRARLSPRPRPAFSALD